MAVCCLVENSSEILLVVAAGDFSRMCSRYWEQTLKRRDVLGREMRVPQEGGKQCVLPGPDWSARNGAESEER